MIIFAAGFFVWIFTSPPPEGFPILEYHTVTNNPTPDSEIYNVPPEDFAAQLDYLKENGYTTVTLQDFMRFLHGKASLPEKPIVLTFDDGYEDNYTEMLPILEAHEMTAVVYVITNLVGEPGYLSIPQLKDMQRRGIEIGSHTADHITLTMMDKKTRLHQIRDSKIFLEWSGLDTIYSFSYPNGTYTAEFVELLRQENYLTAVTGDAGLNTAETNPYLLHRVNVRQPSFGILEFRWRLFKAELFARFRK